MDYITRIGTPDICAEQQVTKFFVERVLEAEEESANANFNVDEYLPNVQT
jgi:hypothetical protein